MNARRPLVAGNWKMHGRSGALGQIGATLTLVGERLGALDVVFCPPAPYVAAAAAAAPGRIGAQDCSEGREDGARTGETSAAMLADCGASFVIVGHSERRALHGESDASVCAKAEAALEAGLAPIICVGETLEERNAGRAEAVVAGQIGASVPKGAPAHIVLAYEPVWAIGTGLTPSIAEISAMHACARAALATRVGEDVARAVRILYGGSVNAANAAEIFRAEGVDGALVGRASLKSDDFGAIISAHPAVVRC